MLPLNLLLLIIYSASQVFATVPVHQDLPQVTLPWGTWQANSLHPDSKILTFQNIRFGKSPTGKLRFQRPQYPDHVSSPEEQLMNNTYGPMCHQAVAHERDCVIPEPTVGVDEDCLFLDIYVPQSAWEKGKSGLRNTPVVVWFYGGFYGYGAKSPFGPDSGVPFYQGNGVVAAASELDTDIIFVAGNYRLGAFGWLAGDTLEHHATANAGLYDQRLLLQWVQDYIGLFGGDKSKVSVWGEAAGGGSIMYHLIAHGGQQDPLFHRAFVRSPGFQWKWDRAAMEDTFKNFTKLSHCEEADFDCLINASPAVLSKANQDLFTESIWTGLIPFGPSVDNDWIQELPAVAYKEGRYWKGLEGLATSHVRFEANEFVPGWVTTEEDVNTLIRYLFPSGGSNSVHEAIRKQYPATNFGSNQRARAGQMLSDYGFICNTRHIYDAYSKHLDVYMMYYDLGTLSSHAGDLSYTFWTPEWDVESYLKTYACLPSADAEALAEYVEQSAPLYQGYLVDFAAFGNPNKHPKNEVWYPAWSNTSGILESVLRIDIDSPFDSNSVDELNTHDICSFWTNMAERIGTEKVVDHSDEFSGEL